MTTGVRCEYPLPEGGYCARTATRIVSRVDAIRDWTYRCAPHAENMDTVWEVSAKLSQDDLIMALTYWPPKHRAASREDAKRVLAEAEAGTVRMEVKGQWSEPEGFAVDRGYVLVAVERRGGFYRVECDDDDDDCSWWDVDLTLIKADRTGKLHVAETGHTVVVYRMQHVIREVKG